ncbi:MAG: ABC transporter permease [Bacilli bacterium]|nr:ABC transporter permease [Bacilli bacterium]
MNKNNILITVKKELRSMFRDKKTLFMIFGFPFIIAFFIFLMGFMEESMMGDGGTTYKTGFNYEVNEVEKTLLDQYAIDYVYYEEESDLKEAFEAGDISGYVIYDEENKNYSIYTDSSMSGMNVSSYVGYYLDDYNQYLGNLKLVDQNINPEEIYNNFTIELKSIDGEELSTSSFLVELVMSLSFTYIIMAITLAAVNMATSAIAVEKEHGTLETILTLPITTNELIAGKYLANVIIGSIASLIGFALTIVSFIIAKSMFTIYEEFSIGFLAIIWGVVICILASFLIGGLAIAITAKSKSYKEAQAAGQVLNYLCMVPIFMTYLDFKVTTTYYLVPILNYTTLLMDLYTGSFEYINLLITVLSTIVCVGVVLWLLLKTFKSEKVLFGE